MEQGPGPPSWDKTRSPQQEHVYEMAHSFYDADWTQILDRKSRADLESFLPNTLKTKRWFGGKARRVASMSVIEAIPIPYGSVGAQILFIQIAFTEGPSNTYLLPLTMTQAAKAKWIRKEYPQAVYADRSSPDEGSETERIIWDPLWDQSFCSYLLNIIADGQRLKGIGGTLVGSTTKACTALLQNDPSPTPSLLKAEQSNTSVSYGAKAILKLYRRLGEGINPDLEIGAFLTNTNFSFVPKLAGALEYHTGKGEPITIGILQEYIANEGDAWQFTLESLEIYFDRVQSGESDVPLMLGEGIPLLDLSFRTIPPVIRERIGDYLDTAKLLGRRTAELHRALSNHPNSPEFAPEPFLRSYLEERHHTMVRLATNTLKALDQHFDNLPSDTRQVAQKILREKEGIFDCFRKFLTVRESCKRIRCHGDFHLGQVLWTGYEFIIIDFEGEPARSLQERRTKHSPLVDVTGMLRSFHYAPYAALHHRLSGVQSPENAPHEGNRWAEFWCRWVSVHFLRGYLQSAATAPFWPSSWQDAKILFDAHMMEKAVYELAYELNNRPDWVTIPLQGLHQLLQLPSERNE